MVESDEEIKKLPDVIFVITIQTGFLALSRFWLSRCLETFEGKERVRDVITSISNKEKLLFLALGVKGLTLHKHLVKPLWSGQMSPLRVTNNNR